MNKKALYHLSYGVYLLTAREGERDNACIINTAVQVANDPTRISLAVIKGGLTHDMIARSGVCNLSALTTTAPFALFAHFGMQSGKQVEKLPCTYETARAENGLLYLAEHASAYLSLKVVSSTDLGSHTLFIAEAVAGDVIGAGEDCTYGYYQTVIKASAPKPEGKVGWRCSVCGYIHEGEELPADFVCPLCKHGAEDFVKLGAEDAPAASAAETPKSAKGGRYVCSVCGYAHEGDSAPAECPLCHAPSDKFVLQASGEMTWAAEHIVGVAQGAPEDIIEGLRANFAGECTEVGMYLAMARVAHREGYPQIGEYWQKAAYEEAEHAAKFAELLGEVVSASTKENLTVRVAAENGATKGKFDLAKRAKELGLDAIHDTVHEMARDEARHGKAFEGLLKRFFG